MKCEFCGKEITDNNFVRVDKCEFVHLDCYCNYSTDCFENEVSKNGDGNYFKHTSERPVDIFDII